MNNAKVNINVDPPQNNFGSLIQKGNSIFIFLLAIGALIVTFSMAAGNFIELSQWLESFVEKYPAYLLVIVLLPLLGVFTAPLGGKWENLRDILLVNITFATFAMLLSLYPSVINGNLTLAIDKVLGYGLNFTADMTSLTLATLIAFIWLMVMIYAPDYMNKEDHRCRFYLFLSITYCGILGTVLAGGVFTTFLFFEAMTFSSYMLVVHSESKEALDAGDSYIYMGIMGGLCILLAMILLFINTGTLQYENLAYEMQTLGGLEYFILALFIIGFGVKAGLVPLHIWLPKAHPVAPTPASALLSGIMVKVGAYGMLRTTTSFFFPEFSQVTQGFEDSIWISAQTLGAIVIWLGIATMGIGIFMAMQQTNIKKMLAFSTVSQMGYIILGIGVAVYLGYKGAMGYSGVLYHIINHALYKSLLFMVAGAVYLKVHTLDINKMGGLWKKMPFTFVVSTIAALGITGMPLFNGFASKTVLHHGIEEAHMYGHSMFLVADYLFVIISAGTACVLFKWTYGIFFGECPNEHEHIKEGFPIMNIAMGGVAAAIVLIGVFPNFLLDNFIIPAAQGLTYDPEFIDSYIVGINIFARDDLVGMVWVYLMGAGLFYWGIKGSLFKVRFPQWLCFECLITLPVRKLIEIAFKIMKKLNLTRRDDMVIYTTSSCEANVEIPKEEIEEDSMVRKFAGFVDKQICCKCETPFIKSDVLLYSMILTFILVFFFVVK
ncbi:proton-conducting transporter membrane subunit [Proteinivorax hydrogeniformans]|uniref:Proton-conducting transporter membrane subunit n=1 Tax=Proteinivorax hydrogeniformans TaxID=1826727 RepID=A0AAU8HTG9_9FIRM